MLVNLGLRFEVPVAGEFAESVGAAEEDVGRGSLRKTQKHEHENRSRNPQNLPKTPAPALSRDGKSGD